MKKMMILLLVLIVITGMAACVSEETEGTTESSTAPQETVSSNPLMAAELELGRVRNGSNTETIGVYAYIEISKETLREITEEEYLEFCEAVADSPAYKWVAIICDDHTGIQFNNAQYSIATYGKISYEGIIQEDIGFIRYTTNGFVYEPIE